MFIIASLLRNIPHGGEAVHLLHGTPAVDVTRGVGLCLGLAGARDPCDPGRDLL